MHRHLLHRRSCPRRLWPVWLWPVWPRFAAPQVEGYCSSLCARPRRPAPMHSSRRRGRRRLAEHSRRERWASLQRGLRDDDLHQPPGMHRPPPPPPPPLPMAMRSLRQTCQRRHWARAARRGVQRRQQLEWRMHSEQHAEQAKTRELPSARAHSLAVAAPASHVHHNLQHHRRSRLPPSHEEAS